MRAERDGYHKMEQGKTITKDQTIGEILDMDRGTSVFFLNMGMHCLGCPSSRGESLEEACMVHGVNADGLLEEINQYLAGKA